MKYLFLLLCVPFALFAQQSPINRYPLIRQELVKKYAEVSPFYAGGKVIVSQSEKYGYFSADGKAITPFAYENGHTFVYGLAEVKQNDLWGYINTQGKSVIPCEYSAIEVIHPHFIIAKKEDKCGIITPKNEVFLPLEYENIHILHEMDGLYKYRKQDFLKRIHERFFVAAVKNKGKWGMIDALGKTIVPVIYDNIELINIDSVAGTFLLIVQKDKKQCLFDTKTQTELSPYFDYLNFFASRKGKLYFKARNQVQEGIMREDGEIIIPLGEQNIQEISDSYYFQMERKNKKILLNPDFQILTNKECDYISFYNDIFILTKRDTLPQKKWINAQNSDKADDTFGSDGTWIEQTDETTLLNNKGDEILKPGHWLTENVPTQAFPFFIVQKEDSFALLRTNGKRAIPLQKQLIMVGQTGYGLKIGHITQIDTLRDTVKNVAGNPFSAQQNGIIKVICDDGSVAQVFMKLVIKMQYGYADTLGNVLIPCDYEDIKYLDDHYFAVLKAGKWGLINLQRKQILPCVYEDLYGIGTEKDLFFVTKNAASQVALWNNQGKKVIKGNFDEIEFLDDFFACTNYKKNQVNLFDRYGKPLKSYAYQSFKQHDDFVTAHNAQVCDVYLAHQTQPISIKRKNRTFLPNAENDLIYFLKDEKDNMYFWEKEKGKWFLKNLQQEKVIAWGFDEVTLKNNNYGYSANAYFNDSTIWQTNIEGYPYGKFNITTFPRTDTLYTKSNTRFVCFGDLWGLQDAQGKTILPQEYSGLSYNKTENIAVLKKNRSQNLLDSTQKTLLTDCEEIIPMGDGFRYKKNNLWGIVDSVGNKVLAPCLNELLDIEYFDNFPAWTSRENIYLAKVKNKKGLIDTKGRWRVLPEYDNIFVTKTNFLMVKKGEKVGLIDSTGKEIVPCSYDYLPDYKEAYQNILPLYKGNDRRDEPTRLPASIAWIRDFTFLKKDGNYHLVQMTTGKDFPLKTGENQPSMTLIPLHHFIVKDTICSYVFDKKGNLRFKIVADLIAENKEKIYLWGREQLVVQHPLMVTRTFDPNLSADEWGFGITNNQKPIKYGIIDTLGREILPIQYDNIDWFYQGYALIGQNRKYGLIDSTGKFKTPLVYDSMVYVKGFYIVGKAKKGILTFDGREIVPPIYQEIFATDTEKGYFKAKKDGKWGFMHISGQEILPFEYEELAVNSVGGLWVAMKDHHCGIIRQSDKKVLVPFEYEGLQIVLDTLGDTLLIFQQNCLYGLMRLDGKVIAAAQYLFIKHFASTLFVIAENKTYGLIDASSGKVILSKSSKMAAIQAVFSDVLCIYIGQEISGLWNTKTHTWQSPFYKNFRNIEDNETKSYAVVSIFEEAKGTYEYGILNRQGKWIFEPSEGIWNMQGEFFVFRREGKTKLYDETLQNLVPLDSGNISILTDSLSKKTYFVRGNRLFSDKGETISLPVNVEQARNLRENCFAFELNNKVGFMGLDGEILITPQYNAVISGFRKGIAKVKKGDIVFFIDIKGNVLGEEEY